MTTTKQPAKQLTKPNAPPAAEMTTADKARMALKPSLNGAVVIHAYQGNIVGKDADLNVLIDELRGTFTEVKGGDLDNLEAMLISQATALQSIFTSLARRANLQEYQKNFESFLGLALKAQAQSRATISALVELKYPRQATFVKQANIAHGPQQVNNTSTQNSGTQQSTQNSNQGNKHAHADKTETEQNKLLEADHGERMDTRAQGAASRNDPHLATVG